MESINITEWEINESELARKRSKKNVLPSPDGFEPYYSSPDGNFVLYHGDCLEIMPAFSPETFDMIFADPPYFTSKNELSYRAKKKFPKNIMRKHYSKFYLQNYDFAKKWLMESQRIGLVEMSLVDILSTINS